MDMPSGKVFDVLLEKGVDKLYHANSVLTSCHFLRRRALLSRGTIARASVYQTTQASDEDDRKLNLWYDVFTDSVDIHHRASRANVYGPVLFVFNIEKLRNLGHGRIWITRRNPTKWANLKREERWFQSIQDIKDNFIHGDFDQMIVFRHCGGELHFADSLEEIVVDDPAIKLPRRGLDVYSAACGALELAAFQGNISVPIRKRTCAPQCGCQNNFQRNKTRTLEMFFPRALKGK